MTVTDHEDNIIGAQHVVPFFIGLVRQHIACCVIWDVNVIAYKLRVW